MNKRKDSDLTVDNGLSTFAMFYLFLKCDVKYHAMKRELLA